jgi:hypothetical protein
MCSAPNLCSGVGVIKAGNQVDVHDRYVEMPGGSPAASGVPACAGQGGLVNWRKLADGILGKDYRTFMKDQPCRLHDFGYRNYGSGRQLGRNEGTRARIDLRFHEEMKRLCGIQFRPGHERSVCQGAAQTVFAAVRLRGDEYFYG